MSKSKSANLNCQSFYSLKLGVGFVFCLHFQVLPKTRVSYLCPRGFCFTDNSYGCIPLLEDSEAKKNKLTLDQPLDKVKSGTPREKESKVICTLAYSLKK